MSSAPFPSLEGLSTAGPLTRSVGDAAAFLDVLEGYEPGDAFWASPPARPFVEEVGESPGRLRIAVTSTPAVEAPVHPDCITALDAAAELLAELGHEVVDASPPWSGLGLLDAFITVWQVSPALYTVDTALMTPLNRGLVEAARSTSAVEYGNAVASLQMASRKLVPFWDDVDVVLTPTLALPPVPIGWQHEGVAGAIEQLHRNTLFTPFTAVANMTGQPAMSLPLHVNGEGLPIGVQAIGKPEDEATLFRLAAQVERARPWAEARPPVS